jgi:hypothetical protein
VHLRRGGRERGKFGEVKCGSAVTELAGRSPEHVDVGGGRSGLVGMNRA